jgi:hypothetical protein
MIGRTKGASACALIGVLLGAVVAAIAIAHAVPTPYPRRMAMTPVSRGILTCREEQRTFAN